MRGQSARKEFASRGGVVKDGCGWEVMTCWFLCAAAEKAAFKMDKTKCINLTRCCQVREKVLGTSMWPATFNFKMTIIIFRIFWKRCLDDLGRRRISAANECKQLGCLSMREVWRQWARASGHHCQQGPGHWRLDVTLNLPSLATPVVQSWYKQLHANWAGILLKLFYGYPT